MWFCKKSRPRGPREGQIALEQAKEALENVRRERDEVRHVSTILYGQRKENHFGQRIDRLLREGK